jgi:hypothetical protein
LEWDEMEILIKEIEDVWESIKTDFELFMKNN